MPSSKGSLPALALVIAALGAPVTAQEDEDRAASLTFGTRAFQVGEVIVDELEIAQETRSHLVGEPAGEPGRSVIRRSYRKRVDRVKDARPVALRVASGERPFSSAPVLDLAARPVARTADGEALAPAEIETRLLGCLDAARRRLLGVGDEGFDLVAEGEARIGLEVELPERLLERLGFDTGDLRLVRALRGGARLDALLVEGDDRLAVFVIDARYERPGEADVAMRGALSGRVILGVADRRVRRIEASHVVVADVATVLADRPRTMRTTITRSVVETLRPPRPDRPAADAPDAGGADDPERRIADEPDDKDKKSKKRQANRRRPTPRVGR